jgi:hypothetical protein
MSNGAMNGTSPKFAPGSVVATPGALQAIREAGQTPTQFVKRHVAGDWGEVGSEDGKLNDEALKDGSRILSAYTLRTGVRIWLITEATDEGGQRVATTLLLPDEY